MTDTCEYKSPSLSFFPITSNKSPKFILFLFLSINHELPICPFISVHTQNNKNKHFQIQLNRKIPQ